MNRNVCDKNKKKFKTLNMGNSAHCIAFLGLIYCYWLDESFYLLLELIKPL